ncbi:MAG: UDP-N-acetylglucosamine--N-acetylmuramyl-(pentapeptide) pyrophosphoryl-undecaprenol N-acetylglucosamine transferase [Nitrosomonadaceae bacterium]|nr:UDP-N-acetylglucosamine--N-acetylmuramyl-(pentapeptide) pyrophosphoryl-undecaprenol N-acetylglucosamine transferase [Nitrosomonadaceae bacterium]
MNQQKSDSPRVVFRADASQRIGFGHLRRCATLGRKLRESGVAVHFLLKAQDVDLATELHGFTEANVVFDQGLAGKDDAVRTAAYCRGIGADCAVIDHCHADEAYQLILLNAGLRWLQFDGLARTPLWADWVISMSPAADVDRYRALQSRPQTRLLLGPRYAILREEFLRGRTSRRSIPRATRLLLTFGGGDDRGACVTCLDAFRLVNEFEITILSGGRNPQVPRIRSWIEQHTEQRVQLLLDDPDVGRRMAEADIAITAGGTTTFEAAMLGLPSLIVQIADNQRANAQAWDRLGVAVDLGPLEGLDVVQLRDQLVALAGNAEVRERMSGLGMAYVDGLGTERIVRELYPNKNGII